MVHGRRRDVRAALASSGGGGKVPGAGTAVHDHSSHRRPSQLGLFCRSLLVDIGQKRPKETYKRVYMTIPLIAGLLNWVSFAVVGLFWVSFAVVGLF